MKLTSIIKANRRSIATVVGAMLISASAHAQNLFVSSDNIYEYSPSGVQSTFAAGVGGGPIAFDSAGNLFAVDNGSIFEYSPSGVQSTFATFNFEWQPFAIAISSAGDLYAAELNTTGWPETVIYKFTPGGQESIYATISGVNGNGLLGSGLAIDSAGDLFSGMEGDGGSSQNSQIYEITPTGVQSTFAIGFALNGRGQSLAFNGAGNLFAASGTKIIEFKPNGQEAAFATGLSDPSSLVFDSTGNLYDADSSDNNIYEFTSSGTKSTFAMFASGNLALQPVPEPNVLGLLTVGAIAFLVRCACLARRQA